MRTKPRHDFPRITSCDHEPEVCRDCLQTNFIIKIQANPDPEWRGCLCPLCDRVVPRSQVQRALGADSEVSDLIERVSSGFLLSTGALYADTDTAEAAEASQLQMVCRCALQLRLGPHRPAGQRSVYPMPELRYFTMLDTQASLA